MAKNSPGMSRPGEGEVHVWYIGPYDRGRGLSRPGAREATREILAGYLGCHPLSVDIIRSPLGKPLLAAKGLSFSLSHTGETAALAVAAGRPIGIDIESVRREVDPVGLAKRFFSPAEAEALAALVDPLSAFFRAWVRKEAYLKALGGTVPSWLSRFAVSVGEGDPRIIWSELEPGMESRFSLVDIDSPTGYIAALAVEGEAGSVRVFRMNNTPGGT